MVRTCSYFLKSSDALASDFGFGFGEYINEPCLGTSSLSRQQITKYMLGCLLEQTCSSRGLGHCIIEVLGEGGKENGMGLLGSRRVHYTYCALLPTDW